jgi:shikimate kinase
VKRLWLIGMTGSGKTTVGRVAAGLLRVRFSDSDALVEELIGEPLAELWAREGEAAFRQAERAVMEELRRRPGIIATGGGAPTDPDTRRLIEGRVVWLDASSETLGHRLAGSAGRPILADGDPRARIAALVEERRPLYRSLATHRIGTDGLTVPEVAEEVVAAWTA